MNVKVSKRAIKDIERLPLEIRQKVENYVFNELLDKTLLDFYFELEKLSGYNNYYRKRIGQYRLGFKINRDELNLLRVLYRKDIYKYFP